VVTGKLIYVVLSFYFIFLGVQRKEEQTDRNISAPHHSTLDEIARLANEKQNPESKRVGNRSRVNFAAGFMMANGDLWWSGKMNHEYGRWISFAVDGKILLTLDAWGKQGGGLDYGRDQNLL
jgi:hypothetical protein